MCTVIVMATGCCSHRSWRSQGHAPSISPRNVFCLIQHRNNFGWVASWCQGITIKQDFVIKTNTWWSANCIKFARHLAEWCRSPWCYSTTLSGLSFISVSMLQSLMVLCVWMGKKKTRRKSNNKGCSLELAMKAPNTLADYGFEPGCQCSLSVGRRISPCDFSNSDSSCPVLPVPYMECQTNKWPLFWVFFFYFLNVSWRNTVLNGWQRINQHKVS